MIWEFEQDSRWMWESGDQAWWESLRASGGQVRNDRSAKLLKNAWWTFKQLIFLATKCYKFIQVPASGEP